MALDNPVSVLFWFFAALLFISAVGVIVAKNPVHAALCLVAAFFTSAMIWMLMEAEFLAIVLVLVYVGAVMVLFMFVVMMLDINVTQLRAGFTSYAPLGAVIAIVVVAEIATVIFVKGLGMTSEPVKAAETVNNTRALGEMLYKEYLYPFELAAVLLLVAIVAAIVLTMRHRVGHKAQDVSAQVSVRARDRIRIVKMEPEKKEAGKNEGEVHP